jgi:PEGA domain
MEYPGAIFTRPWRRLMLGSFFAAFFIISPIVVIYTTGYKYDWKYGFLRETGNISIDILPKHTEAYLDGLKIGDNSLLGNLNLTQTMPITLKNISPHSYSLRLTAPGYHDFEKEIEVANRQTVYIKEIELLKKNKPEQLVKGTFTSLSLSPLGRYFIYTTVLNNQTKAILHDTVNDSNVIIATFAGTAAPHILWAEKNNYVALYQGELPQTNVILLNVEKPDAVFSLNNLTAEAITKLEWRIHADPQLYYSTANTLFTYRPDLQQLSQLAPNTYIDWYIDNDQLWTIETNTSTNETSLFQDALGFKHVFSTLQTAHNPFTWQISKAHNNNVLLTNSETTGYTLVRSDKQFAVQATNALISPYNSWWIMWSPSEIWTYSEGDEPRLLNRSSDKILNVGPLDSHNTLGISWAHKTTALFPYYAVQHDLLVTTMAAPAANPIGHTLYYIDKNGLWKLTY